jgi:TolB protein
MVRHSPGLWVAVLTLALACCAASAAGAVQFQDIAPALGIPGAVGAAWGDHDGDGYADLFLTGNVNLGHGAHLLRNSSDLSFTDAGFEVPVCTNSPGQQWMPEASGTRVVWADNRSGSWDIYLYDLTTGLEQPICTAPGDQVWPGIDADKIVWMDQRSGSWAVYLYDLTTQSERKLSDAPITGTYTVWDTQGPDISGDYVVWSDSRNGHLDVFLYDLSTDTAEQITNASEDHGQQGPRVQGHRIVYRSTRNDPYGDIYLYDIATGQESVVADGPIDQAQPDIWGDIVAWRQAGPEAFDIWYRDLSSGDPQPLITSADIKDHPRVDSRFVVWGATEMNADNTVKWQKVAAFDLKTKVVVPLAVDSQYFGNLGPGLSDSGIAAFEDFRNGTRDPQTNGDVYAYLLTRFRDVLLTNWAHDAVDACAAAGIVAGYDDGTYQPTATVTRDQMAAYIARALAGGDTSVPDPSGDTPTFTDVGTDHWAFKYIEYVASPEANVVQGYDDGSYHPGEVVNRGQMAVYIARAVVSPSGDAAVPGPVSAEPTFSDVTAENDWSWCRKHVEYLASEGIVQGYSDGTYHPEAAITRDQMAVYIQRAFNLPL